MNDATDMGFVIPGRIMDSYIYDAERYDKFHAWIDLVMTADKDGKLNCHVPTLSKRWKWSRGKVYRFLLMLKVDEFIKQQELGMTVTNGRIKERQAGMVVVNYNKYKVPNV